MTGSGFTKGTAISAQTDAIGNSGADVVSSSETTSDTMTNGELISRAKRNIGSSETSLRAAAEDIARVYDQGATQREVAEGVGKSPAWVNRLLKWRSSGYEGTPFGDKLVQGVNKNASPLEAPSTEPTSACTTPTALGKNESAGSGELAAALALAKAAQAEAATAKAEAERATDEAMRFKAEAFRERIRAEQAYADVRSARARSNSPNQEKIHSSTRQLLVKTLGMLGSDQAGERASAALMAEKQRAKLDKTWDELIVREHDDDDDLDDDLDEDLDEDLDDDDEDVDDDDSEEIYYDDSEEIYYDDAELLA